MAPIPMILIGRSARISIKVCEDMLPDYDVIHVILNAEQGVKELPLILSTPPKVPEDNRDNIGSQNYSERPPALAFGGGITDEMFNDMRNACKGVDQDIIWARADISEDNMPDLSETEAFSAETAKRVKRKFHELGVGREGGVKEGVHYF